jgi:ethanolamine phosphate transferase 2 subunit G
LGLDHVGHLGGPGSPLMKPKQKEMDQAIESIYNIVAEQDAKRMVEDSKAKGTLIVVCGDHGMNEVLNIYMYIYRLYKRNKDPNR